MLSGDGRDIGTFRVVAENITNVYAAKLLAAASEMLSALNCASLLVAMARQYFPKSIKNTDKFSLENWGVAISNAIDRAEGKS